MYLFIAVTVNRKFSEMKKVQKYLDRTYDAVKIFNPIH